MSLNGNAESNSILRGKVSLPDVLEGKSAYEIAVLHGFEGSEEEWLESLKADFDERADEAKASIDYEVDNVIVPDAKAELERVKDRTVENAVAEIADAETNSLKVLGDYTNESKATLEAAASVLDEKEELLWENPNTSESFTSGTINLNIGNIEKYSNLRIVFYTRTIGEEILPSVQAEFGKSGRTYFSEGFTGDDGKGHSRTYSRMFSVHSTGNVQFEGADPDNSNCIPYRIYGVKTTEIDISKALETPDETIEMTINPPQWTYSCVASDDIYKPEVNTQYFVTLKNTDGTALGAPVFKLMTAINTPSGAFPTTYTLVGDGTYETGNGILGENNVVELVDWNNGNPIFRFGGINAIAINTQKPYKRMKFYYSGTITSAIVNGTYFLIRLRDDLNDYKNLNADVPFSLTISTTAGSQVAIQTEIYKVNDIYQVNATTTAGTKYSTSNATKVAFVNNNSDVKPCNVMFNTNKGTSSAGMLFANGSKIICEVWYE